MNQVDASTISNGELMPGTYLTWLESPQIASQARPGQFVMVRCGKKYSLRRPLSVHQVDEQKEKIALLYSVVGQGTQWLSQCKPGDTIDLLGPMGNGFSIDPAAQNLLLVAGGIGIAPLRFLAQEALNQGRPVTLLSGAPTATQLYPEHLLPPETKLVTATDDGTAGESDAGAPGRQPAQHRYLDATPHAQEIFDGEDGHRQGVEGIEQGAVTLGDVGDRLGAEGDGVQDDEGDDEE